jgi:capsule polysaccharide export protein KpsE/RkpR
VTPIGLIARIEHILERMPQELQEQERRVEQAGHRLAGYKERLGQSFALQGELDGKLDQLARLEADLATTAKTTLAKAA